MDGSSPHRVLMVRPRGRGGVSLVAERQARALTRHVEVQLCRVGFGSGARGWVQLLADVARVCGEGASADIVHLHTSLRPRALARDTGLWSGVHGGPRIVVQIHGWDRRWLLGVRRHVLGAALRRTLFRAHRVLVVDPGLIAPLCALGAHPEQVARLPNPYDPHELPRERVPEPMVLYLGRLAPGKGVERLVDAMGVLQRTDPRVALWVAGDGPLRAALAARAQALGVRARFLGWVEGIDKRACLARAGVLALPSEAEAAPLAVIEGLAARVPVVATRTGIIPELVGPAGILVDDVDPAGLARALARGLAQPELGEAGPGQVKACSPDRVGRSLVEQYDGLRELVA